jgi:basic membrane protein A
MARFVSTLLLCVALSTGLAAAQDFVVSVSFDGGGWFDRSFNEGTWAGVAQAARDLSVHTDMDILMYNGAPETTTQGLRNLADAGTDLHIAAGWMQEEAVGIVAGEFPRTNFLLIDGIADLPNVRSVLFKDNEGSFLVGYMAGLLSQTTVVGFVGGMDIPVIRNFELGFTSGVTAACGECVVLSEFVGDTYEAWEDPDTARELAVGMRGQGADIIYAAAGDSGSGVIDFVNETKCFQPAGVLRSTALTELVPTLAKDPAYERECGPGTQPLFFIGVDTNQNYLGDTDGNPATMNHGLTSMLKRVDVVSHDAIVDAVSGVFRGGIFDLGLAEAAVGFAMDEYNEALLPDEVLQQINDLQDRIIAGRLLVPAWEE